MSTTHTALSAKTRELIRREFGGDYEEAEYVAAKIQAQSARYPEWVREVAGAKGGWRDPMSWAVRR